MTAKCLIYRTRARARYFSLLPFRCCGILHSIVRSFSFSAFPRRSLACAPCHSFSRPLCEVILSVTRLGESQRSVASTTLSFTLHLLTSGAHFAIMYSSSGMLLFALAVASLGSALPSENGRLPNALVRRATSPDNTCGLVGAGANKGYTCIGSEGGNCCSQNGWCGTKALPSLLVVWSVSLTARRKYGSILRNRLPGRLWDVHRHPARHYNNCGSGHPCNDDYGSGQSYEHEYLPVRSVFP